MKLYLAHTVSQEIQLFQVSKLRLSLRSEAGPSKRIEAVLSKRTGIMKFLLITAVCCVLEIISELLIV